MKNYATLLMFLALGLLVVYSCNEFLIFVHESGHQMSQNLTLIISSWTLLGFGLSGMGLVGIVMNAIVDVASKVLEFE